MPHGETSSRATRIAVQLRPQQKLRATSRSLAIVALLMAGMGATDHPAGEGMDQKVGCFTARAAPGATPMHMTGMQALSHKLQADDAGDNQCHRPQTCCGRGFTEQI